MWFWLALCSAVFGALDVVLTKKALYKVSSSVLAWAVFTLSIPFFIFLVFLNGIPSLNLAFFIAVVSSSVVYIFSKIIFNNALQQNLISKLLPLTSFGGVFTYIFGLIFLSESIRPVPLVGLFIVIFGTYILNADQAKEDLLKPFKLIFLKKESLLFLVGIMLSSITAILDKWGLKNTAPESPIFITLIEQTIMSMMLFGYLLRKEAKSWSGQLKNNFLILFLNSIVFAVSGTLIFYAYINAPVALVLGVQRMRLFFILLMGYLFFKDKPTKHVWIATSIMVLGTILIKLG
jgi:uncharacterized membrane protein